MATPQQATRTDQVPVPSAMTQFRSDMHAMEAQFVAALPAHMPFARFERVTNTAIQNNPDLLRCDRRSLFNALMKCAQDGLLPDGREAAIIPFGTDESTGKSSGDTAGYIPMIAGIRKKVRNSGQLADWNVQCVYEGDEFDYQMGDRPGIVHKPALRGGRTRKVVAAYSIATYPDGTISREVMNIDQIEDIRRKSKAKKGPWSDPVFFGEMARKTVARLHSKQLPMSTDLDRMMHQDDALYEFERHRDETRKIERPGSAANALEWFAKGAPPKQPAAKSKSDVVPDTEAGGLDDPPPGVDIPRNEDSYRTFALSIIEDANDSAGLESWWRSDGQRKIRGNAGVSREVFEELESRIFERCKELASD
jgi:recombination protein RecT